MSGIAFKIPRQAGLVLVLPTSSVLCSKEFNFQRQFLFLSTSYRARRLLTAAVLHSSTQVALTQVYELVYCSCAVRLHYKSTINMGQACVERLGCTLWQAQGKNSKKEGKKGIWMICLEERKGENRKAVWWKTNSHVHNLYSWYAFNIRIYFHGKDESHLPAHVQRQGHLQVLTSHPNEQVSLSLSY